MKKDKEDGLRRTNRLQMKTTVKKKKTEKKEMSYRNGKELKNTQAKKPSKTIKNEKQEPEPYHTKHRKKKQ